MRRRRTSWPSLLVLLCDALLLVLTLELVRAQSLAASLCAVMTLLFVLLHFYLLMHECVHGAVFVEHRHNEWLGHLLGLMIVCPFLTRRRAHRLHHAWTGHPARDPTNARAIQRLSALSRRQLALLDVLWRAYVPVLSFHERIGLMLAPFLRDRASRGATTERVAAYLHCAAYTMLLAYLGWSGQLPRALSLFGAAWVLSLVLKELINLPHHLHAPFTEQRLSASEQGSVTHSCAQVRFWSRFVLLNFGLHEAHHRWPALPWCDLPAAHHTLRQTGAPSIVDNELAWSFHQRRRSFSSALCQYLRHGTGTVSSP